ncbi:Hint domain-containing protein [Paracoccus sp. 11-3]|uniref:Hint domain-containing protein n=1 Tax=Paracoccus amoyensis TaxID=2760093 RepID=A0A926JDT9_9RHOB|nr:Hint domain-containing protein [Paracoccus amoyensis]MBC9248064.1 Hint domain-containing protein [Paracoccus amoyensis]
MARNFTYSNNFDGNQQGGTATVQTQNAPGIANSGTDGNADREFVFMTGANEYSGGRITANALNDEEAKGLSSFQASMTLDFTAGSSTAGSGDVGNGKVDGFSFSFGNPTSLRSDSRGLGYAQLEYGVQTGLTVSVRPINDTIEIRWNNVVIGSVTGVTTLESGAASQLTLAVNASGGVTATFMGRTVNATIPSNQWNTANRTGWDFVGAGRTGVNNGTGYIDDLNITGVVCFARGTMIETADGPRAIEDITPGDLVLTRDHGYQPVRWIGRRKLAPDVLAAHPKLRPIRIVAGAIGAGAPATDLVVSPQHRILVRSKIAQRMFDAQEVLVAARQLCGIDGVAVADDIEEVEYFHLLFVQHEIVTANGVEAESMLPGPQALKAVGSAALEEILEIFPELAEEDYLPVPARMVPGGKQARQMASRHVKAARPLYS